eukprot:13463606-Alexandrium_andersonii.AAC.1
MQEEGLLPTLPRFGESILPLGDKADEVPIAEDSFIDDVAIPLAAATGVSLLEAIRKSVAIVEEVASKYGLRLRYQPSKTAAVVAFRGPGARTLRQISIPGRPGLSPALPSWARASYQSSTATSIWAGW